METGLVKFRLCIAGPMTTASLVQKKIIFRNIFLTLKLRNPTCHSENELIKAGNFKWRRSDCCGGEQALIFT